jgi:tetratricopeptide (TPR) repeat protein
MKQCLRCNATYDAAVDRCPACAATAFTLYVPAGSGQEALQAIDNVGAGRLGGSTHGDRGALLFQQGDLQSARTEFEKQLQATPNSAVAHGNLGHVLYELGEAQEGIRLMEIAFHMAPSIEGLGEYLEEAKRTQATKSKTSWWKR